MGCGPSRGLNTVDDSVHVMLKRDRQRQKSAGEAPHGYIPRPEHPLLKEKAHPVVEEEEEEESDNPVILPSNGQ